MGPGPCNRYRSVCETSQWKKAAAQRRTSSYILSGSGQITITAAGAARGNLFDVQ
jgi:hypothetical protein